MLDWLKIWPDRSQIVDLGCSTSVDWLAAGSGALTVFFLTLLLSSAGSLVGGRQRLMAADPLVGWGLACIVFIFAITLKVKLLFTAVFILAFVLLGVRLQIKRQEFLPTHPRYLTALALQFWVLVAISIAGITAWDDLSHWSPNTLFLWNNDTTPRMGQESAYSSWPEYPYAFPFLGYLTAMLGGQFLLQANAMLAWLMLAALGYALAVFTLQNKFGPKKIKWISWLAWTALATLLLTLFNPGFNASFSVTGQSDTPTAVLVGFMALLLTRLHTFAVGGNLKSSWGLMLQFQVLAVALVLLRQSNIVLLFLLCSCFLLQAWRHGYFKSAIFTFVPTITLPIIAWFMWRIYVDVNDLGKGFVLLPWSSWRWEYLPQLMESALREIIEKWGLFGLMAGFSLYGLITGWRRNTAFDYLAFMTAICFIGYLGFLIAAYLGSSFSLAEMTRAASFYRYSTHVSSLGVICLVMMLKDHLRLTGRRSQFVATACLLLPVVIYIFKPDWLVTQPRLALCADRALGRTFATTMEPRTGLSVISPESNGMQSYIIRYEMALANAREDKAQRLVDRFDLFANEPLAMYVPRLGYDKRIDYVFIEKPSKGQMPEALRYYFGLPSVSQRYFLQRSGAEWKRLPLEQNFSPIIDAQ